LEIITKISSLLAERNQEQKELCAFLQIKPQVFSDWKAGRSQSYQKYLPKIAAFFHCSIDTLLETPIKKEPLAQGKALHQNEVHILGRNGAQIKRVLSDEEYEKVKKMLELVVSDEDGKL